MRECGPASYIYQYLSSAVRDWTINGSGIHVYKTYVSTHVDFPHSHPTKSMSSPSSDPNVSSLQFQDLFDAALREYCKKTGKDIATDPLTVRFFDCKSSDAVLDILEEQVRAFEQFREGDWKVQLLKRLKPTVEILYTFSTSDVVVEGIGLVRLPRLSYS